jgi:hypothetical protein
LHNLLLQNPELADDDVLRADMIEGATDMREFLTEIVRRIEDAKDFRDGSKRQLERLRERVARYDRRYEALRGLVRKTLEIAGLKKYEMPEATVSLKAGQPKVLGEVDPDTLPDEFCRIIREPDKEKIRQALLDGREVPGFVLSNAEPILMVH